MINTWDEMAILSREQVGRLQNQIALTRQLFANAIIRQDDMQIETWRIMLEYQCDLLIQVGEQLENETERAQISDADNFFNNGMVGE